MFAEMFFKGDAKEWSIDFWFDGAGGPLPSNYNPNTEAEDFQAQYASVIEPLISANVQCVGSKIISNFGTGSFGGETWDTFNGSNTHDLCPEDVCVVVRKGTSSPGPSTRGRWRFSGLTIDQMNASYLSTTGQTLYGTLATTLVSNYSSSQGTHWTPAVYSRKLNTLTTLVAVGADILLGTIRRRRPRF